MSTRKNKIRISAFLDWALESSSEGGLESIFIAKKKTPRRVWNYCRSCKVERRRRFRRTFIAPTSTSIQMRAVVVEEMWQIYDRSHHPHRSVRENTPKGSKKKKLSEWRVNCLAVAKCVCLSESDEANVNFISCEFINFPPPPGERGLRRRNSYVLLIS